MKRMRRLLVAAWMGVAIAGVACERKEGPLEELGEEIDEAVDEAEDAVDDAKD
jgi:hypothetical protein